VATRSRRHRRLTHRRQGRHAAPQLTQLYPPHPAALDIYEREGLIERGRNEKVLHDALADLSDHPSFRRSAQDWDSWQASTEPDTISQLAEAIANALESLRRR